MENPTIALSDKKNNFRKLLLFALVYLLSINISFSQIASTKGSDFWYGFMSLSGGTAGSAFTYVSSSSNTVITGTISIQGIGWTQNFTVTPNSTLRIPMPSGTLLPFTEATYNKAVHLATSDSVTVVAEIERGKVADATIVYPTGVLQEEYMVITWGDSGDKQNLGEEILIVATTDSTQINITPSTTTNGGHVAGIPYSVTLNRGESYQILNKNSINSTLTGTIIEGANSSIYKPFSVFSGNYCTNVGGCYACDNLFAQVLPLKALGKEYVLPPLSLKSRTIYRILATQNNTTVTINGGTTISLNKGQYYTLRTGAASYVIGDKPIMIMQFAPGRNCDFYKTGDPFQITMYSTCQMTRSTAFSAFNASGITQYYANIIVKTADLANTVLDGTNVGAQFSVVPSNSTYSFAQIKISQGYHALSNPGGFLAYVYGWESGVSYGYCASANIGNSTLIDSIPDIIVCSGDSVPASIFTSIPSGAQFGWNNSDTGIGLADSGKGNIPAFIAINHTDTSITATITVTTPANGCISPLTPVTYTITVNPSPTITVNSNSPICEGDTLQLVAKGRDSYEWTGPNSFKSNNQTIIIDSAITNLSGNYQVIVTDSNGCSDSATVKVLVRSLPIATVTGGDSLCEGSSLILRAEGSPFGGTYHWNNGVGNGSSVSVSPRTSTTYTVTYTDAFGCINKDSAEVIIKSAEACKTIISKVIIPNVITPNGDGKNDVFMIKNITSYPGTKMIVFDRWGREVYQSEDYKNDWDGGDLSDGSYFYVITVNDKEQKVYKGYVTILSNER